MKYHHVLINNVSVCVRVPSCGEAAGPLCCLVRALAKDKTFPMTGEDSAGAAGTGDEETSGKRGEPVSGASN